MASWRRAVETVVIIASVALCVLLIGPGGAVQRLLIPLFGDIDDPAQRLVDLAFGLALGVLLIPGLALWAWGGRLRPSGTALTLPGATAVSVALGYEGGLTTFGWTLLTVMWVLAAYQLVTFHTVDAVVRRPAALALAVVAGVVPWLVQAGRLLLDLRGGAAYGDEVVVAVLIAMIGLVLALPLLRLESFAAAGMVAAVAAVTYALMSLLWDAPTVALPAFVAVPAVAAAIAYVDTVRHLTAGGRSGGVPSDAEPGGTTGQREDER